MFYRHYIVTDNGVDEALEFLESPGTVVFEASLALALTVPSTLPTFVPLGTPVPSSGVGGLINGGGLLPGFALAVRYNLTLWYTPGINMYGINIIIPS